MYPRLKIIIQRQLDRAMPSAVADYPKPMFGPAHPQQRMPTVRRLPDFPVRESVKSSVAGVPSEGGSAWPAGTTVGEASGAPNTVVRERTRPCQPQKQAPHLLLKSTVTPRACPVISSCSR
jgi:hypothetical protein